MIVTRTLLGAIASVGLLASGGCAFFPISTVGRDHTPPVSTTVPVDSCVPLGPVSGSASCNCFDKLSYDRVRGQAAEDLKRQAFEHYPDSDRVEVSSVEIYLNNAVARGVAYRCPDVTASR